MTVSLRHISGFIVFLWVAALSYDAFTAPRPFYVAGVLVEAERSRTLLLFVGVMLVLGAALITIKRSRYMVNIVKGSARSLLVLALAVMLIMLGIVQNNPSGVAYAILLFFTLILTLYINHCLSDNFYFAVSVALVFALLVFILYHGLPNDRWIGGIHPNHIGAFALTTAYFAARSRNPNRWVLYIIATLFAVLVSSRYAIIAIFIIGVFDYLSQSKLTYSRLISTTFLGLILFITLFTASDFIFNDILRLDDPDRGLGSGMTGRVGMAESFWTQFVQRPFLGYGFRRLDSYIATHNGFLNFVLENGLLATGVLVSLVYAGIYRSIRNYGASREPREFSRIGFWCAWLVAGFFQPQIINFGDGFALTTAFLLTDSCKATKARL